MTQQVQGQTGTSAFQNLTPNDPFRGHPALLPPNAMQSRDIATLQTKAPQKVTSGDSKFTVGEALKNLGKGLISPITVFFEHPLMAVGGLAAGLVACSLAPALIPILAVGFGAYSLYQMGRGGVHAFQRYQAGDFDGAENAFVDIGAGAVGVAMGAFGMKTTAGVAAEAKASTTAIQTGKEGEQLIEAGFTASKQAKKLHFLDALKENASILTSQEGRSALLAQLSPSGIKQRIAGIRDYLQNSGTTNMTVRNITEDSDFMKSLEGQRRAGLSKADISKDAATVLAKAFDDLGIPPELRPTFTVHDELRFMEKAEVEQLVQKKVSGNSYKAEGKYKNAGDSELPRAQVFQDGESPSQFSNEQIVEKAKVALGKAYDEMGIPEDKRYLESLSLGDRDYNGASYNAYYHSVEYHANAYRKGVFTMEEALSHEAKHAQQALLRMQLSDQERVAVIQEELLRSVRQGETEEIILRGSFMGPTMMSPPKISGNPALVEEITLLLKEEIYPNAQHYGNDFNEAASSARKNHADQPSSPRVEYHDLPPRLQTLESRLVGILDQHPELLQAYDGNHEAAISHMLQYMEAHSRRYLIFTAPEMNNKALVGDIRALPFDDAMRTEATQSLRDRIATIEGNGRNQGLFKSLFGSDKGDFDQYQFSPEEVLARNHAAQFEQRQINATRAKLEAEGTLEPKQAESMTARLAELEFELQRNDVGQRMYQAYTRHVNDPENPTILAELDQLKAEYQTFQDKMDVRLRTIQEKITREVISAPFPLRNGVVARGWDDSETRRQPASLRNFQSNLR